MPTQKSESITNLITALSAFQGEIKDVKKNTAGHNFNYADLSSILEMIRPLCSKHGLAVAQPCINTIERSDIVGIETWLCHKSGEYIASELYMPVEIIMKMSTCQSAGTAITYMRRYALCSILGLTQVDDEDGLEPTAREKTKKAPPVEKPKPANYDVLMGIIRDKKIARSVYGPWLEKFGIKQLSDLIEPQIQEMINNLGEPA